MIFGLWLVSASVILNSGIVNFEPVVYSIYTVFYGFFSLLFAKGIWEKKKGGWIGTVSLAIVVIVPDTLAIFDLPTIPGIPKSAAWLEIVYSLIVIIYLTQEKIRKEYRVFK